MTIKRLSHCLVILILLTAALALPEESQVVGVVLGVNGPVFLSSGERGPEIRLKPLKGVARVLLDGQNLRCGTAGKARIWVNGEIKTITAPDGIVRLRADRPLTRPQKDIVEALHDYGMPGGGRGVGSLVWSPPDGGAVRIENLKIRWTAAKGDGPFTLKVSTDAGEPIWSAAGIDAAAGQLPAAQEAAVRLALAQRQHESDPQSITLTVTSDKQGPTQIMFWLLSKQAEGRVEQQLKQWNDDEGDPLLRAIARAHTLSRALVYAEAAEEYDAALALAPESESLLRAAIGANVRTGNVARSHKLRDKLKAASR